MVSKRGLRERRQKGQRNLRSLAACTAAAIEFFDLVLADFGNGTQVPVKVHVNQNFTHNIHTSFFHFQ